MDEVNRSARRIGQRDRTLRRGSGAVAPVIGDHDLRYTTGL